MEKYILLTALPLLSAAFYAAGHRDAREPGRKNRHTHSSPLSIDYFAYTSRLRAWSPDFKVLFSVITILFCIGLSNVYVSAAVLFSMVFLVVGVGGLPLGDYLSVLTVPLAFILLSVLTVAVDISSQPIGRYHLFLGFGYVYTTPALMWSGLGLLLKIIASVSALQLMVLTTPSSELISVLRRARIPGIFVDLMSLVYRFIFILMEVSAKMKNAAESRLGYRDFKTAFTTFGGTASNLLILSLKKAGAYDDAMEARCYDGSLLFLEEEKKADIKIIAPAAAFLLYLLLLWGLTRGVVGA